MFDVWMFQPHAAFFSGRAAVGATLTVYGDPFKIFTTNTVKQVNG